MKKFLQKTLFVLLIIVMAFGAIEFFYRTVPNNYTVKNENLKLNYQTAEVLIFGNSHSFYGLNPALFKKPTFNLSNISQSLYFDYLLFNKHIAKFKKLKYIILTVEYSSLSQLDNSGEDVWRKHFYDYYMDLNVPIISNYDKKAYFISLSRSFNNNVNLMTRYFSDGTIIDCNKNGFGINYVRKYSTLSNYNIAMTVKKHEDKLTDFSRNVSRLQEIIKTCKERNINVILLTMPVSKAYSKSVNQQKLQKIFNTCTAIADENTNVQYINMFNDKRFLDSDFYDADHLHSDGAIKSSQIVNNILMKWK